MSKRTTPPPQRSLAEAESAELPPEVRRLLGRVPDDVLASLAGVTADRIEAARRAQRIRSAPPRKKPTPEEFVIVWQQSATREAIAVRLGLSIQACYSRWVNYRKKGVPLKRLPAARSDWSAITSLAAFAGGEGRGDA